MRGRLAVGIATLLLIALPAGGLDGGGFAGYKSTEPTGSVCGLFLYPQMLVIGLGASAGLAAGMGVGWTLTLVVFRWAIHCGLGEIRNGPPLV